MKIKIASIGFFPAIQLKHTEPLKSSVAKEEKVTPTATISLPALSPAVIAFAAEKGVTDYLPGVTQLVRSIYPGRPLRVVIEDDPELSDNRQIVFQVDVGDMDGDEMFTTSRTWSSGIFDRCPATHVHVFGLDQVQEP